MQLFKRYRKPTRRDRIEVWVILFKNIHAIIKHEVQWNPVNATTVGP